MVLVELFDTSTEADININSILRSLVIPDDLMQPVLPKVCATPQNPHTIQAPSFITGICAAPNQSYMTCKTGSRISREEDGRSDAFHTISDPSLFGALSS